jgi:hypothetical protein
MKTSIAIAFALTLSASAAEAKLYEKAIVMSCSALGCTGTAAKVPKGKSLSLKTASCIFSFSGAASPGVGAIEIDQNPTGFSQIFSTHYVVANIATAPVQPVPMRIDAGKRPRVSMLFGAGTVTAGRCFLRGSIN